MKVDAPFLDIPTIKIDIHKEVRADGVIYLKSNIPLQPHPQRITERLEHWAEHTPQRVFLAQRGADGKWVKPPTYSPAQIDLILEAQREHQLTSPLFTHDAAVGSSESS